VQDRPEAGSTRPAAQEAQPAGRAPSALAARALVEGLLAAGVAHVVLCPGSRSAPLAYAAHAADAAGAWRLHVRVDERSAGFVAVGIARATGTPALVVTTSGTAVANLAPAVLEAHHSRVPLLVVTADRPARLRGSWANQTSDRQAGLFAGTVRLGLDLAADDPSVSSAGGGDLAARAVAAARGLGDGPPGPVHLNVGFDEPLVPEELDWRPAAVHAGAPPLPDPVTAPPLALPPGPRTVVVAGDGAGPAARQLAETADWPLLAEPSSGARGGPHRVGAYRLLLDGDLGAGIERVVAVGRPTLSRPVTRLLARRDVEVVLVAPADAPGPDRPVTRAASVTAAPPGAAQARWRAAWVAAGARAEAAVAAALAHERRETGVLSGPDVAAAVVAAAGAGTGLVLAASNPIRDADVACGEVAAGAVVANRGLSGIDGTVSTAVGVSLGARLPVLALVGDLAFLHDANALLRGRAEPAPRVRVVVVNDRGGGIFGLLEHGEERFAPVFERVFGTPHDVDLGALCAAHGVPHRAVGTLEELHAAVSRPIGEGVEVVEVPVRRDRERILARRLREAVSGQRGGG
jgi:2-succinyl-5-enolpyruvyl-6-hydroxy-3-cyclohexene-1-carboxylate synthase